MTAPRRKFHKPHPAPDPDACYAGCWSGNPGNDYPADGGNYRRRQSLFQASVRRPGGRRGALRIPARSPTTWGPQIPLPATVARELRQRQLAGRPADAPGHRYENDARTSAPPVCTRNGKPDAPLIYYIRLRIVKGGSPMRTPGPTAILTRPASTTRHRAPRRIGARGWRWKMRERGRQYAQEPVATTYEHNVGHRDQWLSEAFFTLNLLTFFMHQIYELVNVPVSARAHLLRVPRACRSWDQVRSAFRLFLFTLVGSGVGAHDLAGTAAAPPDVGLDSGVGGSGARYTPTTAALAGWGQALERRVAEGLGMRAAAPPMPWRSRSLRRMRLPLHLAGSALSSARRHHLRVSPLPNILARPTTTNHRAIAVQYGACAPRRCQPSVRNATPWRRGP